MSIKIQVDPARLDSAAGQIEQQTLSYEKNYRRLFQEVAAMGSGWQGKDNQAFVSQIQGFEKRLSADGGTHARVCGFSQAECQDLSTDTG